MEAILFVGLQGAGKSTFYKQRFFDTHVRVSLDMLRTRRREDILLAACLQAKQPFVVDKTNPTVEARAPYIAAAKAAGFRVVGYYFRSVAAESLARNNARLDRARVPAVAIFSTAKKLQLPSPDEGFDDLYYVYIGEGGDFVVQEWSPDILR